MLDDKQEKLSDLDISIGVELNPEDKIEIYSYGPTGPTEEEIKRREKEEAKMGALDVVHIFGLIICAISCVVLVVKML